MAARLTVVDGPEQGTVYDLKDDVCLLGRALDCQVTILDPVVSRRHARITRAADHYICEDLGSGNGTFVNGQMITRRLLVNGDVVRVANLKLLFEQSEEPWQNTDSVTMVGTPEAQPKIVNTLDARRSALAIFEDAASVSDPAELQRMATRLKTVYAVSEAISNILETDELLPEILNRIFDVFPECERAFIMLKDERGENLIPKAVKRRQARDNEEITVSKTILNEVMTNRHAVLSRDAMADARFLAGHSVANFGIRSMMCAPLLWRGEALGIVYLDAQTFGAFAKPDLELLTGIAGQAALALGNARLHLELLKRHRLEQDLHLAERIQQSFLPKRIPQLTGYTFCARYDPAYEVGGDFYDFIRLPGDRIGIVVGDVSGKGVSAALYMARLTRDLRYFALAETEPGKVLAWMNRAVNEGGHDDIFVTLIYVVLDAPSATITYANAGHMPPVIRRTAERDVHVLGRTAGLPLGVLPDVEYDSEVFQLVRGDSVLLYTDGLVEAMSPARQMYGMDRLKRSSARGPSQASAFVERVVKDMQTHVADAPQFDDMTIVCVGRDE
jgi:phosphoserine phosphatase RsbU/P